MNKMEQEGRALLKSFLYAFHGVRFCIKNERNMRIHLAAAANVTAFSLVYNLNATEYALLFLAMGFVVVCEMLNTAMEVMVNLAMPAYHNLARIAKDVAAGAVSVAAFAAIVVGVCLFFHIPKLPQVLLSIATTPWKLGSALFLLTSGTLFIFFGNRLFRDR